MKRGSVSSGRVFLGIFVMAALCFAPSARADQRLSDQRPHEEATSDLLKDHDRGAMGKSADSMASTEELNNTREIPMRVPNADRFGTSDPLEIQPFLGPSVDDMERVRTDDIQSSTAF